MDKGIKDASSRPVKEGYNCDSEKISSRPTAFTLKNTVITVCAWSVVVLGAYTYMNKG